MGASTIIFLLLGIFCWGLGAFFDKACLRYLDASAAFYVRCLFTAVLLAPLAAWKYSPIKSAILGSRTGALLVLCSFAVSMAGVFFYLKALSGGEATKMVPLSSTYPFVTFVLAVAFLGESISLNKVIGTALLSGGIYFISR